MRAQIKMSRATPSMRAFAIRLMTFETGENAPVETGPAAGFCVCEKLQRHLGSFMGNTGFRTLLARALVLAAAEVSWLRAVRVKPDDSLEGLQELQPPLDPDQRFKGEVALLAQLLGLLVTFIGEVLTLRLVREIWPKVPLSDLEFGNRDNHEESK